MKATITLGSEVQSSAGPVLAKARLLMCSLNLPAKAMVLNMKQFSGEYWCTYCEDRGEKRSTSHLHSNWPYSTSSIARTHRGILDSA